VLKVEVPINMAFVKGASSNKSGEVAYDRDQALVLPRGGGRGEGHSSTCQRHH
jgi:hypothetical protein